VSRRIKTVIFIALLALLASLIIIQGVRIHNNFQRVKSNFHESKQSTPLTNKWMTVAEISKRYNLSDKAVFEALGISPEKGDEKLTLRVLRKKYNIPPDEMKDNLMQLIKKSGSAGKKDE